MGVRKRHDSYKRSLTPNSRPELKKKSDKHNASAEAHSKSPAKPVSTKYATSSKKKQFNSGQPSFNALSKSPKELSSGDDSTDEEYFEPQVPKSSTSKSSDRNNKHEVEAVDIGDASMWPSADLDELISQIELLLPKEDNISYKSRADNLDWEKVAFRTYSAQQCRLMWDNISKKLRGFRILREVLQDAKEWTSEPWKDFYKRKANNRHPDMPRRPLSSYMLYFRHMHDKMKKKNTKLELTTLTQHISSLYKKLPEEKKRKYVEMAAIEKEKYIKEKELFYMKHPELRDTKSKGKLQKPGTNDNDMNKKSMPQKPSAPFRLFCDERLKKEKDEPGFDKTSFNARCRDLWSKMGDEKKGVWINWSVELEEKYNQEMQKYKAEHPEYVAPMTAPKSRLTKDDVATRDRLLGKPEKVPNSAYSLFSTMMLSSEELKTAAPKDRMLLISQQWRNLSAEEKKTYEDRVAHMKDCYKLEYTAYLHSLPPEKRELELQGEKRKMVKKKKHEDDEMNEVNTSSKEKKKKIKDNIIDNLFDGEPEAPPVHPSLLFAKSYRGDPATVQAAWKALTIKTQMKYRRKLEQVKQQYMIDYEEFLKGLDEDQLQEYSNLMKERNGEGRGDESESSSIETEESEPENEKDSSSEESRHSEEKNDTSDEEEDDSDNEEDD